MSVASSQPGTPGKFVTGSTLRHVLSMTAAGSVGLLAIFAVDVLNLFYISQLGQKELAAAVGYAGTLLFFILSLAIGMAIAVSALTSRALGRGEREQARQMAGAGAAALHGAGHGVPYRHQAVAHFLGAAPVLFIGLHELGRGQPGGLALVE